MIRSFVATIGQFDSAVCLKLTRSAEARRFNRVMYLFSRAGDGFLYPLACLLVLAIDTQCAVPLFRLGLIAFAIELTIQRLLKISVKRLRPAEALPNVIPMLGHTDRFSFPSGHTAGAFVFAVIVNHFYPILAFPLYIFASLVGFSRVFNGVHYPSDVVVGCLLGVMSAGATLALFT